MNELGQESSAYLRQHAGNPVHWKPWGEAAWEEARARGCLVLVSVGYSACHWCHVMEREVFEDEGAADVMNAHFVNIKVDREERPEVDAAYMTAVQLMTRQGGWPLNAVCLPDGRPVWGATYVPREQWEAALMELVKLWREDRSAVVGYAERLAAGVRAVEEPSAQEVEVSEWGAALKAGLAAWKPHWDRVHGGAAGAPKFPMPFQLLWLAGEAARDAECAEHVRATGAAWVRGGLHDFAGGGFMRYAVDEAWRLPHFEKMLSDQGGVLAALVAGLPFAGAARGEWELAIGRLIAGVMRDFSAPEGGFYTSFDADSEGAEGRWYWWTAAECAAAFADDPAGFDRAMACFDWTERARMEELGKGAFVPMRPVGAQGMPEGMAQTLDAIFTHRTAHRQPPARDEKVVAGHTAWMAWGLLRSGRPEAVARGEQAVAFLAEHLTEGGRMWRVWQQGSPRFPATLEDYAAAAAAALAAYEATGTPRWAHHARTWCDAALAAFATPRTPLLRFAPHDPKATLFAERFDRIDDVLPSANAVMAENLHTLGFVFGQPHYTERARAMVAVAAEGFAELPTACYWAAVARRFTEPFVEVVVAGPDAAEAAGQIKRALHHRAFVVPLAPGHDDVPWTAGRQQPQLTVYPCEGGACGLPIVGLDLALQALQSRTNQGPAQDA